ncbi:MAG: hypothetical protein ACLFS1_09365, partial [Opitutales bacterium]
MRFFVPVFIICLFFASIELSAQPKKMVDQAKEIQNLLSSGKLVQARPLMQELLPEAEDGTF